MTLATNPGQAVGQWLFPRHLQLGNDALMEFLTSVNDPFVRKSVAYLKLNDIDSGVTVKVQVEKTEPIPVISSLSPLTVTEREN